MDSEEATFANEKKAGKIAMDSLNEGIIRHFRNGRVPFSKVARDLGVTENTIRARVRRLEQEGILQIIGLVDPDRLPGHSAVCVGVKARPERIMEAAEEIDALKGVVGTWCVSGRFNIMLFVLTNDEFTLSDFISRELVQVDGLLDVEMFPIFKGLRLQLRYVL